MLTTEFCPWPVFCCQCSYFLLFNFPIFCCQCSHLMLPVLPSYAASAPIYAASAPILCCQCSHLLLPVLPPTFCYPIFPTSEWLRSVLIVAYSAFIMNLVLRCWWNFERRCIIGFQPAYFSPISWGKLIVLTTLFCRLPLSGSIICLLYVYKWASISSRS